MSLGRFPYNPINVGKQHALNSTRPDGGTTQTSTLDEAEDGERRTISTALTTGPTQERHERAEGANCME